MKNGKFSTKVLVWLLCAVMLVGLTPMTDSLLPDRTDCFHSLNFRL